MKYIALYGCLLFCLLFSGCAEDPVMDTTLQNGRAPEVSETSQLAVMASAIRLQAVLLKENGAPIEEYGFCWSDSESVTGLTNLRELRFVQSDELSDKTFSATISQLKDSTRYYIYAYAINAIDTAFSGSAGVYTTINGVGEVYTLPTENEAIHATYALVRGQVKSRGEGIEQYGFYWSSENAVPSALDSVVYCPDILPESVDTFSCLISSLQPATRYYVRAFAVNRFGEFAFHVDSFLTRDGKAGVGNLLLDSAGYTTADLSARILDAGDDADLTFGFCWSKETDPALTEVRDTIICTASDDGRFSGQLTDLESSHKYYVRAYVTNQFGITFSEEMLTVSTLSQEPNVLTFPVDPSTLINGGVLLGGELRNGGNSEVVEWGICWSVSNKQPTIKNNCLTATDSLFTCSLTGLRGASTYYYTAYATNANGLTGYGQSYSFTTPAIFTDATVSGVSGRMFSAAFTLFNQAYVVGGDLGETCSSDLVSFTTGDAQWNALSPYPAAAGQMTACTLGSNAYLMGGLNKSGKSDGFYRYDARVNTWSNLGSLPCTPRYDAMSFVYRDSVYLLGGEDDARKSKELWRYDPVAQDWRLVTADFPVAQKGGIAIATDDFVLAGLGEGAEGKLWFASDSLTNWTSLSSAGSRIGQVSSVVHYQTGQWNSLFMINAQGKIWEYQIRNNLWIEHTTCPAATNYHLFVINEKIYILGQNLYNQSFFKQYDPIWDPSK